MLATQSPKTKLAVARVGTDKQLATSFDLTVASARLDTQIQRANRAARTAIDEAIAAGAMLIEIRDGLKQHGVPFQGVAKPDALKFEVFIEQACARNQVSQATIYRWMGAAENGRKMLGESIDVDSITVPVSNLLTLPEDELPAEAREARQLLFAWMQDKTIGECLRGVVVDGDEASRITRAQNGKSKGGHNGEDRKEFDKFIGRKLSDISTHLGHFKQFTAGQKDATYTHFENHLAKWPTPVLEQLQKLMKEELKKR